MSCNSTLCISSRASDAVERQDASTAPESATAAPAPPSGSEVAATLDELPEFLGDFAGGHHAGVLPSRPGTTSTVAAICPRPSP